MSDARLSTALPGHPKMKRLVHRLHEAGAWGFVRLILWAAENRPSGDLSGLSDEDLELAVDWHGDAGALIATLEAIGFVDGAENGRFIHDWLTHQPWCAGAEERSATSRFNILIKHHGFEGAVQRMPEFYEANKHRYRKHSTARTESSTATEPQAKNATPFPSFPFLSNTSPQSEGADAPIDPLSQVSVRQTNTVIRNKPPAQKKKGAAAEPEFPEGVGADYRHALGLWWDYKRQRHEGYKAMGWQALIRQQMKFPPEQVLASVEASMAANWAGLFTEKCTGAVDPGRPGGAKKETARPAVNVIAEPAGDWRAVAERLGLPVMPGEQWVLLERSWKVQILKAMNDKDQATRGA